LASQEHPRHRIFQHSKAPGIWDLSNRPSSPPSFLSGHLPSVGAQFITYYSSCIAILCCFPHPSYPSQAMTTKRSQIAKTVREQILAGNLRPGVRLTEKALCALTQASRSSVREALQMLEQEGYVSNQ